jgi:hypothetical protein
MLREYEVVIARLKIEPKQSRSAGSLHHATGVIRDDKLNSLDLGAWQIKSFDFSLTRERERERARSRPRIFSFTGPFTCTCTGFPDSTPPETTESIDTSPRYHR